MRHEINDGHKGDLGEGGARGRTWTTFFAQDSAPLPAGKDDRERKAAGPIYGNQTGHRKGTIKGETCTFREYMVGEGGNESVKNEKRLEAKLYEKDLGLEGGEKRRFIIETAGHFPEGRRR